MFKHVNLRNQPVNTSLGLVILDDQGFVTNLEALEDGGKGLDQVKGFLPAELFDETTTAQVRTEKEEPQAGVEPKKSPTDEEYKQVIADLLKNPTTQRNSEGFIEMTVLSAALRNLGYPLISGSRRKELSQGLQA